VGTDGGEDTMRRLGATLTTFLAVAMLLGGNALAGVEWCAEDPVITVLGSTFSLTTSIHAPASAVGGVAYVIDVPSNAGAVQVSYPSGQSIPATVVITYGQKAYEGSGDFKVAASVTVTGPSGADVIVQLGGTSVETSTYTGTTGQTVGFRFDVAGD
jgi:hypothetical protein